VDKALAIPGDSVTFTLTVTNGGSAAASNVVITDNFPTQLQVVSASSTQGTFTVDGGTVIFVIGTVNPNQVVMLNVVTKVRTSVTPPVDVSNTAILTWPGGSARNSNTVSVRITRGQLPSTGEHPGDTPQLLIWFVASVSVLGALMLFARQRRKHVGE
jgi:uncharacterized repeat protein (TIGR01451 family)